MYPTEYFITVVVDLNENFCHIIIVHRRSNRSSTRNWQQMLQNLKDAPIGGFNTIFDLGAINQVYFLYLQSVKLFFVNKSMLRSVLR